MKVGISSLMASRVSERGVQLAKQYMQKRNWSERTMQGLIPVGKYGKAGIRSHYKHLMYQEKGTKPRIMYELEGKTIPIRGPNGVRFVKATDVGKPGIVTLPGGVKEYRAQKWRHPGIKPTNFMKDSLYQARKDLRRELIKEARKFIGLG